MEMNAGLASRVPAIVTAELLGVPISDWRQLTAWSADFAQVLGNFQHNPERAPQVLRSLGEMTAYFQAAVAQQRVHPREGLIGALLTPEGDAGRFSDKEMVANTTLT